MNYPISDAAIAHLAAKDPLLGRLIHFSGDIARGLERDPFIALASSIVSQQLSISAANTIWSRLSSLAGEVNPARILALSEDDMRACGLSASKVAYIKNIAHAFADDTITQDFLLSASDEDVVGTLCAIKGVGQWTAEMFLIFSLQRPNVFSYGDLGLRKGMGWLWGLPDMPTQSFANAITEIWSPHNSVASLYLWEVTIHALFRQPLIKSLYPEFSNIEGGVDYMETPIGMLKIVSAPEGLTKISLCSSSETPAIACPLIEETKKQLEDYFFGKRTLFDLPLAPTGSSVSKNLWAAMRTVAFGQKVTAQSVAACAGKKVSTQAVAYAKQKNPLLIVIPSHRLIKKDGSSSNPVHTALLNHEQTVLSGI